MRCIKQFESCIQIKSLGHFQPHLFSRTRDFADDFAKSLSAFDEIILLDIYPARELPMEGINSQWLMDKMINTNKTSS
jgi:UDP-N-acetylmuramate--alanine ligase